MYDNLTNVQLPRTNDYPSRTDDLICGVFIGMLLSGAIVCLFI